MAIGLALGFMALGIYLGTKLAAPLPAPIEVTLPKTLCPECAQRALIDTSTPEVSTPVPVTEDAPDAATD